MISAAVAVLETDAQRNELAEFYKRNRRRLFAFAYSRLKNRASAEDAVQDTFLNISAYPDRFFRLDPRKKEAYALTVIRHVIFRMLKENTSDELPEDVSGDILPVEDAVLGEMSAEELKAFINKMPPGTKDAIKLKIACGCSNSEIADILGITEAAARRRISDAYKRIREFLGQDSLEQESLGQEPLGGEKNAE